MGEERSFPAAENKKWGLSAIRGDSPFLIYRKLRKPDLAVLPRHGARKAEIGEHMEAGTARFFVQ